MIAGFLIFSTVLISAFAEQYSIGDEISSISEINNRRPFKTRSLEQNEEDLSWIADYSIKFNKCYTSLQLAAGEEGGNGGENVPDSGVYAQHVVQFSLCPADDCSSCKYGAEYLVDMKSFVQLYMENLREEQEEICQDVMENCYCNDDVDDEVCENQCYEEAGLDYCMKDEEGEDAYEELLECRLLKKKYNYYNGNNDGETHDWYYYYSKKMDKNSVYHKYSGNYYIGPFCSNGSIYLTVYEDSACTMPSDDPDTIYDFKTRGQSLQYAVSSKEPIVNSKCISCVEPKEERDDDDDGAEEDNEVIEMCEELYDQSSKCERNLQDFYYQDSEACDYMYNVLPLIDAVYRESYGIKRTGLATMLAWIFGFATICLITWIYFLLKKSQRSSINLSSQGTSEIA